MSVYKRRFLAVLGALFFLCNASRAQTYTLNGAATQNSCNCYTLTPAAMTQAGSVWNNTRIDLTQSFDFNFEVNLGANNSPGADGMVFILQPISTSVGSTGGGMGFEGIVPSLGVQLDTYRNIPDNDPVADHMAIQRNGVINHNTDLAGPVNISSTSDNVEDGAWHGLRIHWEADIQRITVYFDGDLRLQTTYDLVAHIFSGNPMVFWGFTAATGGEFNAQRFCTALTPVVTIGATADTACVNTPVTFASNSTSFTQIDSYFWDFGNGNTSTTQNPAPQTYSTPGTYTVKYTFTARDGCIADTLRKQLIILPNPAGEFIIRDTCTGLAPAITTNFSNAGAYRYRWTLDGTTAGEGPLPTVDWSTQTAGAHVLRVEISSLRGCGTPVVIERAFSLSGATEIRIDAESHCLGTPVELVGVNTGTLPAVRWNWILPVGFSPQSAPSDSSRIRGIFRSGGSFTVSAVALSNTGCPSAGAQKTISVEEAFADAGRDTLVVPGRSFTLNGRTVGASLWSPPAGVADPTNPRSAAVFTDDVLLTLSVTSPAGCTAADQVKISMFKGSAVYVPTGFSPNRDGRNDLFRPTYIGIRTVRYFTIFNRWGQKIFANNSLDGGWDGTFRGQIQPTGTYLWMVQAEDVLGQVYTQKGSFVLVR